MIGLLIRRQKFVWLGIDSKDRGCEITIIPVSEADYKVNRCEPLNQAIPTAAINHCTISSDRQLTATVWKYDIPMNYNNRRGAKLNCIQSTRCRGFIRAFFSYTIVLVHTRIIALAVASHGSIAITPAACIDPAQKGNGNYA